MLSGLSLSRPARRRTADTPLHIAASRGDTAVLIRLLDDAAAAGSARVAAAVHALDDDGQTPLHCAAYSGSAACCAALLRCGADPAARDDVGVAPQELTDCDAVKRLFESPLHTAARCGDVAAVARLLRPGASIDGSANVDCRDALRQTPLHIARIYGEHAVAELLLRTGADPWKTDGVGIAAGA